MPSKAKTEARYLIYCNRCHKQTIGTQHHREACSHCFAPNPLWRKLGSKEHLTLHVDLVLA